MSDHDDWDDDDDGPIEWADPKIRADYEAALGRLILAHNVVDRQVTELIECCLKRMGNPVQLAKLTNGLFAQRLDNLAMLKAMPMDLQLKYLDVDELKELNRLRNIVAHGHFEQNPFMGDYELITNKKRHADFSVERMDEITARLDKQAGWFSPNVAFYDFSLPQTDSTSA